MNFTGRQTVADRIGAALIGGVGILFLSPLALGQSDEDALAAVRACSQIENDAERLACVDEALGVEAVSAEPAVPAAEADQDAGLVEARVVSPPPGQPEVAEAAPVAVQPAEAESPPEMNRRERRRAANEEAERTLRIVEIRRSTIGVLTFIAEDGEAWVERSASAVRFPQVPFDAVLRPAMGDSYFLVSTVGSSRARVVPAP